MSEGEPIIILAGLQRDGTTYQLHPLSQERVRHAFPGRSQAPSVFVGYETQADFETLHGSMWSQIAILLTGVELAKLQQLGPVLLRVPATGREIEVAA